MPDNSFNMDVRADSWLRRRFLGQGTHCNLGTL